MELDIEKMSPSELWEYAEGLHDNGDYKQAAKYMKKRLVWVKFWHRTALQGITKKE
jgi:hypothetical protein